MGEGSGAAKSGFDRSGCCGQIGGAFLMSSAEPNPPPEKTPRRKRKFLRWLVGLVLLLGVGLLWLDGPGLRWLGPLAARHFLPKAGFSGDFRIEGSLSRGFAIADLKLQSAGLLGGLTLDRATPHYRWSEVVKGKLDGLSLDGVHADLRVGLPQDPAKPKPDSGPLDLAKIAATIRQVRERFLPIALHLTRISLAVTRDGQPVVSLAPTAIHHLAGNDDITLEIGAITDPTGREWPAQKTTLSWAAEQLTLDRLDPLPVLGVRELAVRMPVAEAPSLHTLLRLGDAEFELATTPGFKSVTLSPQSGTLQVDQTAKAFGVERPASAKLTSLRLTADNVLPDPFAATARVELALADVVYQDWEIPELILIATLAPDRATATVRAQALGSPVNLDCEISLTRAGKKIIPGNATGTFEVPAVPAVISELAKRSKAIAPDAVVPEAALNGSFAVVLEDGKFEAATVDAALTPGDLSAATPIAIKARYQPDQPLAAEVTLDGLKLAGSYDLKAKTYEGELAIKEFSSARIDRWLAIAGVTVPGTAGLTAEWAGGGDLIANTHRGDLTLAQATWEQPEKSPLIASGEIGYRWPGSVTVTDLKAATEKQTLTLAATLADDTLTLSRFLWLNDDAEMAEGSASIPVPKDFSQWRDTLAHDTRPVAVTLESRVLSLSLLEPWLPAAAKPDSKSTGKIHLKVAGSCADPSVDFALECLNLRAPDQPKLPPADLKLTLKAAAGKIALDGSVTAPDFPRSVLTASLPFRPAAWAEAPDSIMEEVLTARADLPRLDLSRFLSLVPAAKQLAGIVTGHLEAAGRLGSPDARGSIRLENAAITLINPAIPPIQAIGAEVDFSLATVTLKNLRATIAGGSLSGGGSLTLTDKQPSALDFRFRADHLPLLRNERMIVRANADLRLAGPRQTAGVTGTVSIVDSLFYRDIELLPIGKPFTTPSAASLPKLDAAKPIAAAGLPAPFGGWTLKLDVRTQDPF
ncbi:MAG: hypothetical protein RLZZ522_143, partial [Verrucomicrobiota bacterium]